MIKLQDPRYQLTYIDSLQFVFILGRGRSGTTLISASLSKYEDLLATHEAQFMLVFYQKFSKKKQFSISDIEFILKHLWIRQSLMQFQWQIDMDELKKILLYHLKNLTYQRLCKIIYTFHHSFRPKVKIIIDKNPVYSYHVDKWLHFFPNSKFIILVRDYRDQYLSMISNKLKPIKANGLTSIWAYAYNQLLSNPSLNDKNTLYVKFEDLIENKDLILNKIIGFLNISSKVSTEQDFISSTQTNSKLNQIFYQRHKNVNKKIDKNNKGKWKKLPHKTILELEKYNAQTGKLFGYQPSLLVEDNIQKNTSFRQQLLISFFSNYMYKMPIKVQSLLYDFGRFIVKQKNRK